MLLFERFNLGHGFRKYFQIHPAIDDALRDDVYRVRHEVYCEDLGFEPVRLDRLESDEYDVHSEHCLLRTSSEPIKLVGCTRLVLTNPLERSRPLPFEHTCAATLDRSIVDPARLPRETIAEVSRLAVRADYRRRRGESRTSPLIRDEDFGTSSQPRFPYIPIGLYLGALALAERHGIETVFMLTEPRLATHLARLGVDVRQIGGAVEHRGTRIPSMMNVQSIIKGMRFMLKPMWATIREEIHAAYADKASATRPA
ncbi:Autoinducer synthetase [Azoarcus sp. Aa7]|nr:Autoinducer synthetase [Azoarcus sp. Aa7]